MVYSKKCQKDPDFDPKEPLLSTQVLHMLGIISSVVLEREDGIENYVTSVLRNNPKNPRRVLRKLIFATKDQFNSDQLKRIETIRVEMRNA